MPFSNGIRIEHVLVLGVFLFVRHAFGKSSSASGPDSSDEGSDGEHEEHDEGFVVSMSSRSSPGEIHDIVWWNFCYNRQYDPK